MALAEAVARIGNGCGVEPVAFALPSVGGQAQASAARVELLKIDGQAVDVKRAERGEQFGTFFFVAAEGRNGDGAPAGLFFWLAFELADSLFHRLEEHRMRVDFDESVEAIAKQILDGIVKKDGLAQIFGPVGSVKRGAVFDLAGDRGINWQRAFTRLKMREKRWKLLAERLDVKAMGGNVDRDAAAKDFFFLECSEGVFYSVGIAGKNGGIEAILRGDGNAAVVFADEFLSGVEIQFGKGDRKSV